MSRYRDFSSSTGPAIEVHQKVLQSHLGTPEISHDNIEVLFNDKLYLPAADHTVKFYDGSELGIAPSPLDFWRNGYRLPVSNTLHIPTWEGGNAQSPMHRLVLAGIKLSVHRHQHERFKGKPLRKEEYIRDRATQLMLDHASDIVFPGHSSIK